jgi:hypothetical protein
MTFIIESPAVITALGVAILELGGLALFLWSRLRRAEDRGDEVEEHAEMQGDALREALNEIDRYRRLHRRGS